MQRKRRKQISNSGCDRQEIQEKQENRYRKEKQNKG